MRPDVECFKKLEEGGRNLKMCVACLSQFLINLTVEILVPHKPFQIVPRLAAHCNS